MSLLCFSRAREEGWESKGEKEQPRRRQREMEGGRDRDLDRETGKNTNRQRQKWKVPLVVVLMVAGRETDDDSGFVGMMDLQWPQHTPLNTCGGGKGEGYRVTCFFQVG